MKVKQYLKKKNIFSALIIILSITVIILFAANYQLTTKFNSLNNNLDKENLKKVVYSEVEKSLQLLYNTLEWDKEVDITEIHPSHRAAKGLWSAHDVWDWIAWENNDNSWKVLTSHDGYDCQELDTIPEEYKDFFHDQIYKFSVLGKGEKYCYNWSDFIPAN